MSEIPDQSKEFILVKQFIEKKDRNAFEKLITVHLKSIRRLLCTIFNNNSEDIQDAEQEILLKLYLKLHKFRFQSSFKTYLYSFVRNSAIDILRKKKKEPVLLNIGDITTSSTKDSPEEIVLRKEKKSEILQALCRLKEEEKSLLVMKDMEGMTISEISKIMDLPEGTIKSRLHRTRDKLIVILNKRREPHE